MSIWYIGECMSLIINMNNVIKELTHGYQNCYSSHTFVLSGYVKVRKYLYARVISWDIVIPYFVDTRAILHGYGGSSMVYRSEWKLNTHTLLVLKKRKLHKINAQIIF
jgi:hypothetical protein